MSASGPHEPQFCADPAKVDLLRQNAKRLYDLLAPGVKQELDPGRLCKRQVGAVSR